MTSTRQFWLDTLLKITLPVLEALAEDRLKETLPIEGKSQREVYQTCTYLEAFGRSMIGLAPWLGCEELTGEEEEKRQRILALVHRCLKNATDPSKKDCMNFSTGMQPIVDAAFLAQAILRAPRVLWDPLEPEVKQNILACMRQTRTRKPSHSNWLLFSATIECLLRYAGEPDWDPMRIDFAIKSHLSWYKGDGVYGDGNPFRWDYYNSYVIQPMLVECAEQVCDISENWARDWNDLPDMLWKRLSHYASIQEHMIAPDGSYPLLGRSLCYRFGAFQSLAMAAWRHRLDDKVTPAGVRCGLTAVIRRIMAFDNFGPEGFLTRGVCGSQPDMAEVYISTGSLYLCTAVFLPLGLPETDPFWSDPDADWTMKQLWSGQNRACEHALD